MVIMNLFTATPCGDSLSCKMPLFVPGFYRIYVINHIKLNYVCSTSNNSRNESATLQAVEQWFSIYVPAVPRLSVGVANTN